MDTKCLLVSVVVALVTFLLTKYFINVYGYWRKKGIPYVKGALPILGNSLPIITFRQDFGQFCDSVYKANKGRSMVGFFQFGERNLLIRDPEIVKTVLISSFPNFHVNVMQVDPALDPLVAKNPFFTDGEEWKTERSRLTVALMSSKKLKILIGAVKNVCVKFSKYLEDNVKKSKGSFETEAKDFFSSFTGENVASAGFGVEGDFFSNGSGPNSFRANVMGIFDPTRFNIFVQTVLFFVPKLNNIVRVSFIPKKVDRFFRRVISEMIKLRQKDGIERNDFLQIMMDLQTAKYGKFDEFSITASATSFFLDGYETSAVTLSFFAYQVAAHPHIQDKLRKEVERVMEKHNGEVTYEALSEMTYMDQALSESMRIYPALGALIKRCNEQCKIVGNDGIECLVEPGTVMVIPIRGLQTDPQYWENPEIYDPDRFGEDNKKERPKTVFLPFGEGPRICPGMRFAILQMKAAMATILRNYSIEVSSKTKVPLKLTPSPILSTVEGGIWIKFKPL